MCAEQCSVIVNKLHQRRRETGVQLLVMGDVGDEPFSRPVEEFLLAIRDRERVVNPRTRRPCLYNRRWLLMDKAEPGTFYPRRCRL